MNRLCLFAAVAGIGLVSAAPPPTGSDGTSAWSGYPPCSRTVTDRCIQLYERGVRTRDNLARNERPGGSGTTAVGGPYEAAPASSARAASGDYPPCSATVTDRCIQLGTRSGSRRTRMAGERVSAGGEQIQMAGERG